MTQPQQLIEEDPCPRLCSSPGCSGSAASAGRATMRSDPVVLPVEGELLWQQKVAEIPVYTPTQELLPLLRPILHATSEEDEAEVAKVVCSRFGLSSTCFAREFAQAKDKASTGRSTMRSDRCSECAHDAEQPDSRSCTHADWMPGGVVCKGFVLARDPETPGVYEDRPVPASGRLLSSTPIYRCSLCRAVATVHLPPELGASALCRACADRVRAALEPSDEAERRQMDALYNLGLRGSRVPRCTCPDCCR